MQSISTDEFNETPDELEQAVSLIAKSAKQTEAGMTHAVSVRLPTFVFVTVKAMAEHSEQSMNRIMTTLLRVGIDAVHEELPPEDAYAIETIRARLMNEVLHPGQQGIQFEEDK